MNKDKHIHLQIPCETSQVKEVRRIMREFLAGYPFSDEDLMNLDVVINEGVTNAISHGSANDKKMVVDLDFTIQNKVFIIVIKDYGGKEFNPDYFDRIATKKEWGQGGRGIYLMKTMMDEVAFIFCPGNFTTLYLSKKLNG
jgi:anti-sigma regulatory factor (Ser/Thr protein kinase)